MTSFTSSATGTASAATLVSTNPTAVPLSDINGSAAVASTVPLDSTASPGATPTFLGGAPALPDAAKLASSNYPALDKVPPTDTKEVQAWVKEVADSGVTIPSITTNVAGGCRANPSAAADTSRCWWTCGGCTRPTDVTTCPDKYTWGLTYDDGPSLYTPSLLNYLDQHQLKSTFFAVGSRAISYPKILQEEYMSQHQIAVHTWSHPSLTTLTNEQIIAELGWSRKIIKDVTGVTPNMMRPPYGDIDDRVRAICTAMGLTPVMWTNLNAYTMFDTQDFDLKTGAVTAAQVLNNWQKIMANVSDIDTGFIVLEHDLFQQTVEIATGYILPDALAFQPKFSIKPVVECLNKPLSDAYVETTTNFNASSMVFHNMHTIASADS
ncbi:carbohydrate esterase family 4 protein [Fistulina hepatica ATCC 64428]|uniref:chitin deacetylase n=1 Tax=Fistulina hepatica ATCC 64428 TaxID=1128425 RepID=A0A0D7A8X6_9AGAR|nr:carbohydrate esterase family 4 protein [Fistulina hepatica ATCC 64428]